MFQGTPGAIITNDTISCATGHILLSARRLLSNQEAESKPYKSVMMDNIVLAELVSKPELTVFLFIKISSLPQKTVCMISWERSENKFPHVKTTTCKVSKLTNEALPSSTWYWMSRNSIVYKCHNWNHFVRDCIHSISTFRQSNAYSTFDVF